MINIYTIIGQRIKDLRSQKKLKTTSIVNKTNLKLQTLLSIENNSVNMSIQSLMELCNYFDITPNYLVDGDFYEIISPTLKKMTQEKQQEFLNFLKMANGDIV